MFDDWQYNISWLMEMKAQKIRCLLYIGDASSIISKIDEPIALTVTSPPYFLSRGNRISIYGSNPYDIEASPTYEDYINKLVDIFGCILEKTMDGGKMAIVIDDVHISPRISEENYEFTLPTHALLTTELVKQGWLYKGMIVWKKIRNAHASGGASLVLGSFPYPPNIPIIQQFEFILIFQKKGKRNLPPEHLKEASKIHPKAFKEWASTGIWEIMPEKNATHPAPFPIEIPYRLISLFSFKGETVLDPFMGIGTTGIACTILQRNFIGIELYENYVQKAAENISSAAITIFNENPLAEVFILR